MHEVILEKTFSVCEAAKILKLHPLTVRRKLARKEISFYRFGKNIEIGKSHLREFIARNEVKAENNL